MSDEHDDDLEREVNEGADIEAENYPDVAEDIEEDETRREPTDNDSRDDTEKEHPSVEDDASDTI